MRLFGADNVLVIGSGKLATDPVGTTWKVAQHARPETPRPDLANLERRNVRTYKTTISDEAEAKLKAFYAEPNEKLWSLLNRELEW